MSKWIFQKSSGDKQGARIDGPSWPYDGPVWEEVSAKGILGFVRLPNLKAVW